MNSLVQSSPRPWKGRTDVNEVDPRFACQQLPATSTDLGVFGSANSSTIQGQVCPDPMVDNTFIVMRGMTTHAAFFCIADILKLACMQESGFNIRAPTSTLPAAIAPTLQQQAVPHRPYVDMLPWPSLRDRILNAPIAINELELIQDMGSGDLRIWGCTPWDPMGWEVSLDFATKWWFLIDDSIVHTTNFWRRQRGEEALVLASS